MYLPLKASSIKEIKIKTYTLDLHFLGVAQGLPFLPPWVIVEIPRRKKEGSYLYNAAFVEVALD